MDDQRLVQLFQRFRDSRDTDALAKVFDCLAPGLLKVARHLTRDTALSEDLLQSTFLTAMERAAVFDETRPLRPWLVGILLHHARYQRRRSARTLDRNRLKRAPERDTCELAEEREFERAVEEAIGTLPETYRQVLIPRLMQGLRGTEIARKVGRSPGVVRMQIHRGLSLLKRALPQSLLSALLGLLWSRRTLASVRAHLLAEAAVPSSAPLVSTLLLGGMVMLKKVLIGMAGLFFAGACLWLFCDDGAGDKGSYTLFEENRGSGLASLAHESDEDRVFPVPGGKEPILPDKGSTGSLASPGRPSMAGRVLDARGQPVSRVRIWIGEEEEQAVKSDAAGHFLIQGEMPAEPLSIAPPYMLVRQGLEMEGTDLLLVVAPRINLSGTILNEEGSLLAGTRVGVKLIRLVDFPEILDRAKSPLTFPAQEADGQGQFALQALPEGCALLRMEKDGFETLTVPVSSEIAGHTRFVLQALTSHRVILSGWVVDHIYRAVPKARVGLGKLQTETDDWGAFRLEFHREEIPEGGATLYAAKRGYQTRVIDDFGSHPDELADQIEMELSLAGPALTISGRLLDGDGKPVVGSSILPWREAYLMETSTAEDLALAEEPPERDFMLRRTRAVCFTDGGGAFALGGLSDRTYRLRVFDTKLGFAMTTPPIAAGRQDVELRIPAGAFREKLSGCIVNRNGKPMPGLDIRASMQLRKNAQDNAWHHVGSTRSAEDGTFILPRACKLDTLLLAVCGTGI